MNNNSNDLPNVNPTNIGEPDVDPANVAEPNDAASSNGVELSSEDTENNSTKDATANTTQFTMEAQRRFSDRVIWWTAMSAAALMVALAVGSLALPQNRPTTFSGPINLVNVDRAFGENAGDAPARVCEANADAFDLVAAARENAKSRQTESKFSIDSFARGSTSVEAFYACAKGRMMPSMAIGDLDGDLLPEVLSFTNTGELELYWNNGGLFKRTIVPQLNANKAYDGKSKGGGRTTIVLADADGDGLVDLVTTPTGADFAVKILRNLGGRVFAEVPVVALAEAHTGQPDSSATGDINRDGIVDIVQTIRTTAGQAGMAETDHLVRLFLSTKGQSPYYEEVTSAMMPVALTDEASSTTAGAVAPNAVRPYQPFTPIIADFDGDGADDIFIAADGGGSRIYYRDGEKFVDYSKSSGIAASSAGMGVQALDLNGDGLLDLFTTEIAAKWSNCGYQRACDYDWLGNFVFINQGKSRTFVDEAKKYGLMYTDWAWGYSSTDLNSDGNIDLFIGVGENTRGRVEENWYSSFNKPYLMTGNNDGTFTDSSSVLYRSLRIAGTSAVIASGDFDGDMLPDIIIGGYDIKKPYLMVNRTEGGASGMLVLRGRGIGGSPVNGEGAVVKIEIAGHPTQTFSYPSKMANFRVQSANTPIPVGFGSAQSAKVTVKFTSGESVVRTIYPNKVNMIGERGAKAPATQKAPTPTANQVVATVPAQGSNQQGQGGAPSSTPSAAPANGQTSSQPSAKKP